MLRVLLSHSQQLWMYLPISMKKTITAFSLRTFLRKTWRLNFTSGSMYFVSLGFKVLAQALSTFQTTLSSNIICGEFPFARPRSFLSFSAYHRFSEFRIRKRGIATRPKNSTLWSRSSSYTVTSNTEFISLTLLKLFHFYYLKFYGKRTPRHFGAQRNLNLLELSEAKHAGRGHKFYFWKIVKSAGKKDHFINGWNSSQLSSQEMTLIDIAYEEKSFH